MTIRWVNMGSYTADSSCLEDRRDVAITFVIPHKQEAPGRHRLEIKAYHKTVSIGRNPVIGEGVFWSQSVHDLTWSEAKAYPEANMKAIHDAIRTAETIWHRHHDEKYGRCSHAGCYNQATFCTPNYLCDQHWAENWTKLVVDKEERRKLIKETVERVCFINR